MEEKLKAGVSTASAVASKDQKSGSKKKKSGGKSSKRRPGSKPQPSAESGGEPGAEVEEAEAGPGHVEISSPSSKKRKSGSDCSDVEEEESPVENKVAKDVLDGPASGKSDAQPSRKDQAGRPGKGKKLKSENDEAGTEPFTSSAMSRHLRPRKQQAIMQDIILGQGDASRIIGRKIKVFWPLDDRWYSGHVKSFDGKKKRHHVLYDDGDEEWLELKAEKIKLQVNPGEVFGEISTSQSDAQPADDGQNSDGKRKADSVVGNSKKNGGKRKEEDAVDTSKKNNGKKMKEEEEKMTKFKPKKDDQGQAEGGVDSNKKNGGKRKKEEEENAKKSKLEKEDEVQAASGVDNSKKNDGKRRKDGDKANKNKLENEGQGQEEGDVDNNKKNEGKRRKEEEETAIKNNLEKGGEGQAAGSVDNSKKKDGKAKKEEEEKTNKTNFEKEDHEQVVEGDREVKRPKNSKRTAPRTKRAGGSKQVHKKHVAEDETEGADSKQESVEHADVKLDENLLKDDSADINGGEKQQNAKESVISPRETTEAGDVGAPEQMSGLLDGKQTDVNHAADKDAKVSNQSEDADVEKQEQTENAEKEASAVVAEKLDEKQTAEKQVSNQAEDDEMEMRPKMSNQEDEKQADDENVSEKQKDVEHGDQVSKKHALKKHRGRAKAREPGKR